ncbi:MAG TPA: NlpC/P60 family protein [Candidatus Limnocylindrales bacterium]|nr:NlpC/P60 family protein [Candidatus Limnocylindrales bacterium]
METDRRAVAVVAAGLWTSPGAIRPIDAPALQRPARIREWAAAQGPAERRELWGRLETQVLLGDVVHVDEVVDGWARVVVPAQPSRKDFRGYPGWLPLSQLDAEPESGDGHVVVTVPITDLYSAPGGQRILTDVGFATILPVRQRVPGWIEVNLPGGTTAWVSEVDVEVYEPRLPSAEEILAAGRQFVGLMYLAGGAHGLGLDCSSLIHLIYRRFGHVIPRDAADKIAVGEQVAVEDLEPGDLLFFAKPDTGFVYHCGICVQMPAMLHVSQTDWACLDGPMTDLRRSHLITGRRLRSDGASAS